MTINGTLQVIIDILKAILSQNFLTPVENWPNFFWGGECGRNAKFCFWDPKSTSLREKMSFDVLIVKIGAVVSAVGWRNSQKQNAQLSQRDRAAGCVI